MFIEQAKQATFKKATINDWKKAALSSLKNVGLEDLYANTYENLKLDPLYVKQQIDLGRMDQFPGEGSFLRGFYRPEKKCRWRIAQKIAMNDWAQLKKQIKLSLERGQDAVAFDPLKLDRIKDMSFKELGGIVPLDQVPLLVFAGSRFDIIADKLLNEGVHVMGAVGTDILSAELLSGLIIDPDGSHMEDWVTQIKRLDRQLPHLRTIVIDTTPFKEAGAHVVQELGISLSLAVFYIEQLKKAGWSPEKAASKLIFRFAIGSEFFMELSKFRAFRVIWKTVAEAYGIPAGEQAVSVSAETAKLTKSVLDPYVNMLRAGNEAFAGILGGVDYLHVGPFDELSGTTADFSMRIARNTQLLLKEESYLDQVVDPAGGSYYIEALTSKIVNGAWEFFQEIDKKGGMIKVLQEGWIQEAVKKVAVERLNDVDTRKTRAVGVNVYAMGDEQVRYPENEGGSRPEARGKLKVEPLQSVRIAEKFESLRKRAQNLSLKGKTPTVGLICLGELKEYKPYADFVSGVLASAGIQAVWNEGFEGLDDIKRFILESPEKNFCLCGPRSLYTQLAAEIGRWAEENTPDIHLDIAGSFTEQELASLRMDGSYYFGQNIFDKMDGLLNRWEARVNG